MSERKLRLIVRMRQLACFMRGPYGHVFKHGSCFFCSAQRPPERRERTWNIKPSYDLSSEDPIERKLASDVLIAKHDGNWDFSWPVLKEARSRLQRQAALHKPTKGGARCAP